MEETLCIVLSERNRSEKPEYSMIPNVWHFGKGKPERVKRSVVARDELRGREK